VSGIGDSVEKFARISEALYSVYRDQVIGPSAHRGDIRIREVRFGADIYEHCRIAGSYTTRKLCE
jgi:hypothetical protein